MEQAKPDSEYGYIVIRSGPDLPEGFLPEKWEGRWERVVALDPFGVNSVRFGEATARPTGRYETSADGKDVAEVWEVQP